MEYEEGILLAKGKTKEIREVVGDPDLVVIQQMDTITAHDNPELTKEFEKKAQYSTTTTCRVFELLRQAGIPVAYKEQISPTKFVAQKCNMLPVEAVARRFAVGSYLKRHPDLVRKKGEMPLHFHPLTTEFFLKTTKGKLLGQDGEILVEGLDPKKGQEDPLIQNPYSSDEDWKLFHAKKPEWSRGANLRKSVNPTKVLTPSPLFTMGTMEDILRKVFLTLEGAWNTLGLRLIDLKIEFGIHNGVLYVADVIDNDSWRLRTANWEELSKEVFRQGGELSKVEENYEIVASLTERFRIPQQVLVLWKGSKKDAFNKKPQFLKDCEREFPAQPGFPTLKRFAYNSEVKVEEITLSGHKSPWLCLDKLELLQGEYPDGGVIIVKVGGSNGLGPMLAARTTWPVIAVPAGGMDKPEDIWSSLRMPSSVPLATVLEEENAIQLALNILSQKNPLIYAHQQKELEKLDA